MLIREFVDLLRTDFYEKLQSKTGWGKNEIISLFEKSVSLSLADLIDRNNPPNKQINSDPK